MQTWMLIIEKKQKEERNYNLYGNNQRTQKTERSD